MPKASHYIPADFNHPSICGLSKDQWRDGTNNWDWVRCSACLARRAPLVAINGKEQSVLKVEEYAVLLEEGEQVITYVTVKERSFD